MEEYNEIYREVEILLRESEGKWSCACSVQKDEKIHVLSHPILRGGFSSKEDALGYAKTQIDAYMAR